MWKQTAKFWIWLETFHMNFTWYFSWEFHAEKIHVKITLKQCLNFHMKFIAKFTRNISLLLPVARENFKWMCLWLLLFLDCRMSSFFFMFSRVVEQSKENRMQVHNVAIVFGPTLIWPETVTPNLAANMIYQSRIVEYCLLEFKNIFRWKKHTTQA